MEKQMVFHILGMAETKEEGAIKRAYMTLLRERNPEDHPEAFKELRQAYEEALRLAKQTESEQSHEVKLPVDQWIEKVDTLYTNILERPKSKLWQALLSDPVCTDLDTAIEARHKMVTYLLKHLFLPQQIWILLDQEFQFVDDQETLKEHFPQDFLKYISNCVNYKEGIEYSYFQVTDKESMNADAYIRMLNDIKARNDRGDIAEIPKLLEDQKAFGLYHPFAEIEELRYYLGAKKISQAEQIVERLLAEYPAEPYLMLHAGQVYWELGKIEEAHQLWNSLLEINPEHYLARRNTARYLMTKGQYNEAKEIIHDLIEQTNDQVALEYLKNINQALIKEFQEKLAGMSKDDQDYEETLLELGWCYFGCGELDAVMNTIQGLTPSSEQEYSYINLFSRTLYQQEKYAEALPQLRRWLDLILSSTDEDEKEYKTRRNRLSLAYIFIGVSLYKLDDAEEWVEMITRAIETEKNVGRRLAYMQQLGSLYNERKEYEKSIEICDQIIATDSGYYPAYLIRQEAFFQLKNGREVIQNYLAAVRIYPGHYKPYLLAARVYYEYNASKDGLKVLEQARNNNIEFTDMMKLYQIKMMIETHQEKGELDQAFEIAMELLNYQKKEGSDLEDPSEVEYAIGLIYWHQNKFQNALEYINKAIASNPQRNNYQMGKANLLRRMGDLDKAISIYQALKKDFGNAPGICYRLAECFEEKELWEKAVSYYQEALQLEEGYHDTYIRLSRLYRRRYQDSHIRKDFDNALLYANILVEKKPHYTSYLHRGRIYLDDHQLAEALMDFAKASELSPDTWESYNDAGYCYEVMRQLDQAIEYLHKSISCLGEKAHPIPFNNLATCYYLQGDYEKAIYYKKEVIKKCKDPLRWFDVGDYYKEMGKFDEALNAYQQLIDNPDYLLKLSYLYWHQGQDSTALSLMKKYVAQESGGDTAGRLTKLGDFYLHYLGNFSKAIVALKKAVAAESDSAELYEINVMLAEAYYWKGNNAKAEAVARTAMEYFKKSKYGTVLEYTGYATRRRFHLYLMGSLALMLKQMDEGKKYLDEMAELCQCSFCHMTDCYEYRILKGRWHRGRGEQKMAAEAFEQALKVKPDYRFLIKIVQKLNK